MLFNAIRSLLSGRSVDFIEVMIYIAATVLVIFMVLPLHEFAHAATARRLGDRTAEFQGRLTLNPLASIDPMGSLCLLLFGFGWARPVPVDARNFRKPRRDMAIVATMGPVSNLLAALVGNIIRYAVVLFVPVHSAAAANVVEYINLFLWYYISINVSLAVFNFLPIPPLDGSRVLSAVLPLNAAYAYNRYQRELTFGLMLLLFIGVLDVPLHFLSNGCMNAINFLTQLPFRLFGVL